MKKLKKKKKKATSPSRRQELPANYDQQVEQLTAMAMSIIYDEQNGIADKQLPEALQNAQQTVQAEEDVAPTAIANVAMWVLATVEQSIESRGKAVQPIVVLGALGRIVAEVYEAAQAVGAVEMTEEDAQIAIAAAINLYIPQARKEGKVTDEQLKEAAAALQKAYPEEAANFQQMVQARAQRQAGGQPQPTEQPGMMGEQPKQGLLGGAR